MNESDITRRGFLSRGLAGWVGYAFLQSLWTQRLFAEPLRSEIERWVLELDRECRELKGAALSLTEWQDRVEGLLSRVDRNDLFRFIDFDKIASGMVFPDLGTATAQVRFPKLSGLPERTSFHKKIFGLSRGRAIIPHGHRNMVSAHLVLKGEFRLRHFDRVRDEATHLIMRPTIDRRAVAGGVSSISDERDNIHWFQTLSEQAFTFDLLMTGIDPTHENEYEIDNIDPAGAERIEGDLLRVRKLGVDEALRKYGKELHH